MGWGGFVFFFLAFTVSADFGSFNALCSSNREMGSNPVLPKIDLGKIAPKIGFTLSIYDTI